MTDNTGDTAATGGNIWDKLTFAVKGDKGTATADGWVTESAGPVGGFLIDLETAEGLVRQSDWIVERLQETAQIARDLVNIQPPAEDPGSMHFTEVARQANQLGADNVQQQWEHARAIAKNLRKALNVYKETDEQAGTDVKNAGGGDGGGLFN
ncbi:type VII secretion target [Saccharomonospora glauca]|uniref:Uncharacterized protein n=1 Tax=Saccharomonospora glauca K62 TaxID=928724 RepID=I1CZG9_9PSEU|nr:type VII secretion target [Saccharomonospora glauca]EIE98093.1 Protein of unknown function (DUF2580) [Saccharomonospora glauca K62]